MHIYDPFTSVILGRDYIDLIYLCELFETRWTLLYRASVNGFGSNDFHANCDEKSQTLTILKAKETGFIFGGYTEKFWQGEEVQKFDSKAFIFSLTNKDNTPCQMKIRDGVNAIFCASTAGPSFGTGEIHVVDNSNTNKPDLDLDSFSNLGETYIHSKYVYGSVEAKSFLAGSYNFLLDEIEVYHKQ